MLAVSGEIGKNGLDRNTAVDGWKYGIINNFILNVRLFIFICNILNGKGWVYFVYIVAKR